MGGVREKAAAFPAGPHDSAFPSESQAPLFLLHLPRVKAQAQPRLTQRLFCKQGQAFPLSQLEFPSVSDGTYVVVFGLGMRKERFSSCLSLLWLTFGLLK